MKATIRFNSLTAIILCLFLSATLSAQKNYFSIEGGRFYGGSENNIKSQMRASGFGDRVTYNFDELSFLLAFIIPFWDPSTTINITEQYPKSSTGTGKFWVRYGREIKDKRFIELSYGKIHNSSVEGFDVTGDEQEIDGNRLKYTTNIAAFTAHYMFLNKKRSLGAGGGLALAFDKLYSEANNVVDTKHIIQPGLSGSAYWRFINGKVFFMSLRTDAMLFIPANIQTVTLTSPKGRQSIFQSAKVNSFSGDVTVSMGLKF